MRRCMECVPRPHLIIPILALAALLPAPARTAQVPPGPSGPVTTLPPGRITGPTWLGRSVVTEYWPAPEAWARGALVTAPGLGRPAPVDWLYSSSGMSMEGTGYGRDGRLYHVETTGDGRWVNAQGQVTTPRGDGSGGWSRGRPAWRAGGFWRNDRGALTYPLAAGGWANGVGRGYVPPTGITFGPGGGVSLRFWRSVAVDTRLVPRGSRVYIPAYHEAGVPGGGWMCAEDTGGAVIGAHFDVWRPPASSPAGATAAPAGNWVLVVPPAASEGDRAVQACRAEIDRLARG